MHRKISIALHSVRQTISLLLFLAFFYLFLSWIGYVVGWNLITGEWITYSSEQYCYSLKYPGRWRLYVSGDGGWHGGVRPNQRAMLSDPKPYFFGGITFRLDQIPLNEPTLEEVAKWSAENWSNITQEVYPSPPLESVTVNGQPAMIRTFSSGRTEVYVARESDGLIFSVTSRAKYQENAMDIFQQLLDEFSYQDCYY
jgi:hypothetical protein